MFFYTLAIFSVILLIGYCYLLCHFRRGFDRLTANNRTTRLSASIIVPARNEEKNLPHLLQCLSEQTYSKKMTEIILVNDRSSDNTEKIMNQFKFGHKNVKVITIEDLEKTNAPKKYAITQAIKIATGEIIITTDADTQPEPDWINSLVSNYEGKTGMVLGYAPYRTDGIYNTLFHKLLALDYFAMGAIAAATAGMQTPITCNGANLSYRKNVFEKIGGFGESENQISGDDDLLLHRIQKERKWKIVYAVSPNSAVCTNPPLNLRELIRQRIRFASKHLAYPPKIVVILFGVYLFYVSLLGLLIGSLFQATCFYLFLGIWIIKGIGDLWFLSRGQKLLEKRNLLKYYVPASIFHLIYVTVIPILGQIMPRRW